LPRREFVVAVAGRAAHVERIDQRHRDPPRAAIAPRRRMLTPHYKKGCRPTLWKRGRSGSARGTPRKAGLTHEQRGAALLGAPSAAASPSSQASKRAGAAAQLPHVGGDRLG
jgi:hypothetical protein